MQTRRPTASAGYGTGHIESNECIGTSPVFRASTPSHIQEPSVPTKMVAPGQSFQRFNTPTQHLQQTTTLQPPPAGNPRPVVSSPSACAAGVLRGAASWFEPNIGTTQERYPPQPDTTRNQAQGIDTMKTEHGIPEPIKMERSETVSAPPESVPDLDR